ncbi:MAG: RpiB/LacA/LacB family sugar-phosphate isomerase [bacterium]|nr:RpiB/LacA/LacB family sugar-phosphate isomerase [bacterium]
MRIALINDNSQASKNAVIASSLQRVCDKYNYELINMGMFDENDNPITYVEEGLMAAILLNSGAVDFVVTGCGTGEGAMMALNSFPNVYCGLITDATSAYLFSQINAGNAVSLPYAYNFGWGVEITLTNIFDNLFKEKMGGGYPKERAVSEKNNREILKQLKSHTTKDLLASIPDIDKDLIEHIKKNQKFIEIMRKYGNKKYIEVLNIR